MSFKYNLSIFLLLAIVQFSFAQVNVSGLVTSKDDGQPLPGVSVLIEGTQKGTTTDFDGKYSIEAKSGDVLVFSFIGMTDKKITVTTSTTGSVVINAVMESDTQVLDDVVVTALGIKKSQKSLGYAQVEIKGEDLSVAKERDIATSIAGKVAGVQVLGGAGSTFSDAKIRVRGVNSLTGGNAIFVVDGTVVESRDVNMDDVETLSVLKGPAATALYGSRGSNGVIMITTKKGKKSKDGGWGVSVNQNTSIGNFVDMLEYQDKYAGGYAGKFFEVDSKGKDWDENSTGKKYKVLQMEADESWGPKIDGKTLYRPWYTWFKDSPEYGKEVPLTAQPDNVRDFYEMGVTSNTNIALSKAGNNYSARVSYTNIYSKGIAPNSKMVRNYVKSKLIYDLTDQLKAEVSANYNVNQAVSRPFSSWSDGLSVNNMKMYNQWWQRQLNMKKLKEYYKGEEGFRSWNMKSPENPYETAYWDSPYFNVYESVPVEDFSTLYGHASLTYKFNDKLKVVGIVRTREGSYLHKRNRADGGHEISAVSKSSVTALENNYEFLATYEDKFMNDEISLVASFGGNIRMYEYKWTSFKSNGGLTIPGLYNIKASKEKPNLDDSIHEKQVNSFYGTMNLGYKDFLFVDLSLRNDWSSTLPKDNNSYLYPSVNASFIFSDLLADDLKSIISFGKLRSGWGQVGSDTDPYETSLNYPLADSYGSTSMMNVPTTLPNTDLKPALSSSWEVGFDLKFLDNRLGLDVTYYRNSNKDQIIDLSVSSTSGYSKTKINAGSITTQGIEVALYATPIKTDDLIWDMSLTFAKTSVFVDELADGLEDIRLTRGTWAAAVYAKAGKNWGIIKSQKAKKDDKGRFILEEGNFDVAYTEEKDKQVLPDFTGGMVNTLTYKGFTLSASLDYQIGGTFLSLTKRYSSWTGIAKYTAENDIREHGVVIDGVDKDGNPNTTRLDAKTYFNYLRNWKGAFLYDATFVKLREISLSYRVPKEICDMIYVKKLSIGFNISNVALIYSATDIDSSELETQTGSTNDPFPFLEAGQNPSVRSYGLNLKFNF